MKVSTSRFVLTFFATIGLYLTIASAQAQTNQTSSKPGSNHSSYSTALKPFQKPLSVASTNSQTESYRSDHYAGSASSYSQPYANPAAQPTAPIVQTVYIKPALSMALPTAGPYQEGFQFRSRHRMSPTTFVTSSTPFPTVAEQVGRVGTNTLDQPPSYLGDSTRMTGQRISQEVVRMSLLRGVMGLKKPKASK